jgi:predicted nucleic acid-binding protein
VRRLLISDANVLIDLRDGGVLEQMFELPLRFATLDVLMAEELDEDFKDLQSKGLAVLKLQAPGVADAQALIAKHPGSGCSRIDMLTLALARQEAAPLLTGDQGLRRVAEKEGVEVHGTIWVMEALLEARLIDIPATRGAYAQMRAAGSRLPWDQIRAQLALRETNKP